VLDPKHVVITLKSAGENSSELIEVSWSPRKTRELAQIDEARSNGHRPPNPRLVQAIVRAYVWLKLLTDGTHGSIEALAPAVGLHPNTSATRSGWHFCRRPLPKQYWTDNSARR
jgi:hypothetical protein